MPFIIAECGVNWRDLVDADDMIREAAKAGADAVKFQAYRVLDFTTADYQPEVIGHLAKIQLDESTIRYLYWRCQQHGIELMVTPFYPDAVSVLSPFVKRWKVRCADHDNTILLKEIAKTGKDCLISIEGRINAYTVGGLNAKFLYCCSEYPPGAWPVSLEGYDGYSCHIPASFSFKNKEGPEYIEVHVRLDKYEPHYCPIDCAVSITMSELAELCRRLKG